MGSCRELNRITTVLLDPKSIPKITKYSYRNCACTALYDSDVDSGSENQP